MNHMHGFKLLIAMTALFTAAILVAPAAQAQDEPAGPNTGAVSFDVSLDIVTQYFFRGYLQEDEGLIFQPGVTVNASLYAGEDAISSVDVYATVWNSIHSEDTGAVNSNQPWYETDYVLGASLGMPAGLTFDPMLVFYTYPNGSVPAITEVAFSLAYDDAQLMEGAGLPALSPYVVFAFELADAGGTEDAYFEFGVAPSFLVLESQDFPITLAIPVAVGLSLDDYYGSDTFGYVSAGIVFSTPLSFVPTEFGAWEASAGVTFLFSGDALEASTTQDEFEVYGKFGLSMSY